MPTKIESDILGFFFSADNGKTWTEIKGVSEITITYIEPRERVPLYHNFKVRRNSRTIRNEWRGRKQWLN